MNRMIKSVRHLVAAFLLTATAASAQTPNTQRDVSFTYDPTEAGTLLWNFQEYNLNSVHALSDGKIMVVGSFNDPFYNTSGIMRLHSDGSFDDTFDAPDADENVVIRGRAFAELPNGEYLLGGSFTNGAFGSSFTGLMKLNNDGSRDESFGDQYDWLPTANAIAVQPDGKIIVGGQYASMEFGGGVTRFNPDGSVDPTFMTETFEVRDVRALALLPDGRVVVSGNFGSWPTPSGSHTTAGVAILNADGTLDPSFSHTGSFGLSVLPTTYPRVAAQPDGKIVVAGLSPVDSDMVRVVRYNADGSLDNTFYEAQNSELSSPYFGGIKLQSDGKIILCGYFIEEYDGNSDVSGVFRLNADGTLDDSFDTNNGFGNGGQVFSCDLQNDGKILLYTISSTYQGEELTPANGFPVSQLVVRLNGDGVGPPASVQETPEAFDFTVYPNPSTEYVMVDDLPIGCQVFVTNLTGQTLFTSVINDGRLLLNTSDFTNGVYLLHVSSTRGVATKRFVVNP